MKTIHRNEGFFCAACNTDVPAARGTCRDHCTACLHSRHVDDLLPGDRASGCEGMLVPIYAQIHSRKGIMIHFQCDKCGIARQNKAAEDDNQELLARLLFEANRRTSGL